MLSDVAVYLSETGLDMIMKEIVDVQDKDLWDYMYSYYKNKKTCQIDKSFFGGATRN